MLLTESELQRFDRHIEVGGIVEVRTADEILATLTDGALDRLPFMPEMLQFCGKQFRVHKRINKICLDGHPENFRQFQPSNVFILEGLRCTGTYHSQCDRNCMLFWKEAWLKPAQQLDETEVGHRNLAIEQHQNDDGQLREEPTGHRNVRSQAPQTLLRTSADDGRFICQSTKLVEATATLPSWQRPLKNIDDVRFGNMNVRQAIGTLLSTAGWKVRGTVWGKRPRGHLQHTPTESLGLQAGDLVRVKPYDEIVKTLDNLGCNRGLLFGIDMRKYCGQQFRVSCRVNQIILEHSGEMIAVNDTVLLEGTTCGCKFAIGGCPRAESTYWREIWLKRISLPVEKRDTTTARAVSLA